MLWPYSSLRPLSKPVPLSPSRCFKSCWALWLQSLQCLQLGLLHMRPLQYWLKPRVPSHVWHHGRLLIRVDQACVTALAPWTNVQWMEQAVPLGMVYRRKVVSTDASNTGWGVLCEGKTDIRPLVESRGQSAHQLPRNAGGMSGLSNLPARPKRTPRPGPLGQHDCGVLHKSSGGGCPRGVFLCW